MVGLQSRYQEVVLDRVPGMTGVTLEVPTSLTGPSVTMTTEVWRSQNRLYRYGTCS